MKNKKNIDFYIFSIIFTIFLGSILHFTFDLSNKNSIIATFSATNESTWEHLKLAFFPMLITIFFSFFYSSSFFKKYVCAKTIGIITAILFIVIFFYTYTGIIGTNYAFLDIGSFVLSVILGEYVTYKLINSNYTCNINLSIIILLVLLILFVTFTFFPPKINLFKDPISNTYGIN